MKKTLLATTLAATTIFPLSSAFAADSVDVKVIGTISPVACTPTLSGGGTVDYGTIKSDTLKADDYTVLPVKSLDFAITCDGNAKVAVKAINGRMGTAAGGTEDAKGSTKPPVALTIGGNSFGLGLAGTKKIGGYALQTSNLTYDGKTAVAIYNSADWAADTWISYAGGPGDKGVLININSPVLKESVAATGTLVPIAFKNLAGKLEVQAYINKGSELDLTKPIQLDGLTTLELVYL
jgi:type 1 fimbria pilin